MFLKGACTKGVGCSFRHSTALAAAVLARLVSGGGAGSGPQGAGAEGSGRRPCVYFHHGTCLQGSACAFAHEGRQAGAALGGSAASVVTGMPNRAPAPALKAASPPASHHVPVPKPEPEPELPPKPVLVPGSEPAPSPAPVPGGATRVLCRCRPCRPPSRSSPLRLQKKLHRPRPQSQESCRGRPWKSTRSPPRGRRRQGGGAAPPPDSRRRARRAPTPAARPTPSPSKTSKPRSARKNNTIQLRTNSSLEGGVGGALGAWLYGRRRPGRVR